MNFDLEHWLHRWAMLRVRDWQGTRVLDELSAFSLREFLETSGERLWPDYLKYLMRRVSASDAEVAFIEEWVGAGNDAQDPYQAYGHLVVIGGSLLEHSAHYKGERLSATSSATLLRSVLYSHW